jgi:hypothetical protein
MKRNLMYSLIGMLVVSILFSGIVASASAQTVSEVQAAIKAKGANWVAGETPMSRLTLEQKRNMMGLIVPPEAIHPPISQPTPVGLPASIDWRNNGGNYVSDVKSQGSCNSCWAFSTTAAVESAIMIANRTPNLNLDLMEAVLISCCTNCSTRVCGSGYLGSAADYMVSHGEPLQTCPATDCGYNCPNQTIKSWESIPGTVDSLRTAIANSGPVVVGMHVYDDFYNYMGGVYSYTGAGYVGDHAVVVIGYNDAGQYFIGKNSWDTSWGEAGFFRIAYSEVTGTSAFGIQSLAYQGGSSPNPPPTCSYPIGDYFPASGGTGNVQVSTASGCAWSATSNAAWITITSGSSGSGSGAVAYSVAPNTTSSRRTGTMTVPGGTYTVLQEQGSSQCTYSISPTSNSFAAAGGSGSVNVTAGSGCSWTATTGASWISITSGASGSGNGTFSYAVTANTSTASRAATVSIGGQTFTVSQQGATTCSYTISPTAQAFTSTAGTGSVSVTSASGCTWAATSNATSWITVTGGASGSGNGSVSYSVAANTTTSSRSGTLTVAGQTFTVTQAAMVCTYAVSPTSANLASTSSTGSISVTSASGCGWTASSNASWIGITGAPGSSGNGNVTYSVAANSGSTARTGALTVAGTTVTVTQAGVSTCSVSLTIAGFNLGYGSRQANIPVYASSDCSWSASTNVPWITFVSGTPGTGDGTVTFFADSNPGAARTGTITIGTNTLTINQGGSSTCTYTLSPTSQSFSATSSTGTVNVTSGSGCAWTAASNATSWLTVTGGASGSGNGTVSYSVAANTTTSSRSGTMTIAGQTFTVSQQGASCTYSINPTSQSLGAAAGTGSVNVTSTSGCGWTATSNATSWLTVTSGSSGSGNGSVSYSVAANTTTSLRSGTLTVAGQTFTVSQAGAATCSYSISPGSNSFGAAAGTGSVSVTSGSGCAWTAASNATSWLSVTSGSSGSGNGSITYSATANTGTTPRTGTMTIAGQTFTLTQQGVPTCSVYLTIAGFNFGYTGRQANIPIYASSDCSWSASTNVPWITFTSGATGTGNGTVAFAADLNPGAARIGTITIGTNTVTINQGGNPSGKPALSASPVSLSFGTINRGTSSVKTITVANGGQADLKITSVGIDTLSGSVTSFSQSHNCSTVSPKGSCTITVKFSPGGPGTKSTSLRLYSDGGVMTIPLTGTAQ